MKVFQSVKKTNIMLHQVTAPYFCAAFETHDDEVVITAPILKYMKGWNIRRAMKYCYEKHWKVEFVLGNIHIGD